MKNNKASNLLMVYSLLIPPVMILLFAMLGSAYGKSVGYFLPYGIYLVLLLIGTVFFHAQRGPANQPTIRHNPLYYILAFVPVVATFFVAFMPTLPYITTELLLLLLVYALLNGLLEELFWRFTFNEIFGDDILRAYIIPTAIFSCWHVALLFANGVSYHGGAIALVGGASVLGAIWGFVMLKTKNITVVICAHVLTNFFAFSQLLYENWFAK